MNICILGGVLKIFFTDGMCSQRSLETTELDDATAYEHHGVPDLMVIRQRSFEALTVYLQCH